MNRTRLFLLLMAAVIMVVMLHVSAEAFWGLGASQNGGTSGLDLEQGYDRNTVVTMTGRVVVSPHDNADEDPVTLELDNAGVAMVVVLGPGWYLQDDNLDLKVGDSVTVRGSKAQGKDGRTYLLAQWVTRPSGGQLVLRNDAGRPGWSAGFRGNIQQGSGQQQRGGAGGRRGR